MDPRPKSPTKKDPDPRIWVVNPNKAGLLGWLFRYYLLAAWLLVLATIGVGIGVYRYFASSLPPLTEIERYEALAPGVTRIYGARGELLAELAREHRAYASFRDIPAPLVEAFLAAEDRRFYGHGGLDYRGLARAALTNVRSGTIRQGGSTITQQVAKGLVSSEQTLARKIREAILSLRIESRLSKDQILEIYLNKIFLGHGAYGVAAAASRYFDKSLGELTLAESALVAGLARAPSRYSPFASPDRAKTRRAVVLQDMVEAGYITPAQRDEADAEPITLAEIPDVFRARTPYYAEHVRQVVSDALGEEAVLRDGLQIETPVQIGVQRMAEASVDAASRKLDRRQGYRGPVTHLERDADRSEFLGRVSSEYGEDPLSEPKRWRLALVTKVNKYNAWVDLGRVQARMPVRMMNWAARYDRNSGENDRKITDVRPVLEPGDVVWVRPAQKPETVKETANTKPEELLPQVELGQVPRIEAALYTVDHQTGYVVATQGGNDYDRSQFNRSIQGCRQPGSVFKAVYYAYALDTGRYHMGSILDDKPYEPEPGEEWDPQNIHGTIEGKVILRNAFIFSLNLPSIRLFMRLGADNVVTFARRLGFTTELIADKALSLGASCVRMDELSRAFGTFVRQGQTFDPAYLRRVTDKGGALVLDHRHPYDGAMDVQGRLDRLAAGVVSPPEQVVDARTSFLITKMMRDVVTSGIGRRAQRIGVPAGGKSGTASKKENTTDTWFVGFTSRFVTAAWMGDDKYERSMGDEDASYTTATPLWTDYMTKVVDGIPHRKLPLSRPPGLRTKMVDLRSGGAAVPGQPQVVVYLLESQRF